MTDVEDNVGPDGTDASRALVKPEAARPPRNFVKLKRKRLVAFLDLLAQGSRRGAALKAVGVSRDTFAHMMREDVEFSIAVDQAELEVTEAVVDALVVAAKAGNPQAIKFYLTNRDPANWKDDGNRLRPDPAPEGGGDRAVRLVVEYEKTTERLVVEREG